MARSGMTYHLSVERSLRPSRASWDAGVGMAFFLVVVIRYVKMNVQHRTSNFQHRIKNKMCLSGKSMFNLIYFMWERLSSRENSHRGWKAAPTFNITCSLWITGNTNFDFAIEFSICLYVFCRRRIVFHLPSSQRQMKRKVIPALSAPLR